MTTTRKFAGCISLLLVLAVLPHLDAQTTVTLATSPNPSVFGAPVALTATVTPSTATGRITFYDGVTVLGTKPLVSGAASLSTILLPSGARQVKAYYAGDASNAAATSNVISQTVNARPGGGLIPGSSVPGTLLAVADFNGDGKADLVVSGSSGLTILLGDGAGNFQVASTQNISVISALVGDFNGDGIPDLACVTSVRSSSTVNILLGKGDGTFQPASFAIPNFSQILAVGDFNGDGKADIVANIVFNGEGIVSAGVEVLLGNGDGTFQPPVTNPIGAPPSSNVAVVADFNGDGKADLATISGFNIDVLLGKGDGTFQPPAAISVTRLTYSLAVGDFNGDGKPDLVTNNADVLLGKGDGTFQSPVSYSSQSPPTALLAGGTLVAVGDFNGDGRPDFALSASGTIFGPTGSVSILFGNGDGTFQPQVIAAVGFSAGSLLVGEFNGDGITDLAASSLTAAMFFLGSSKSITPTAGTPQSTTSTTPFSTPLQVTVRDGANPLSGVMVTFTAPIGPSYIPTATLSSGTAVTDANGVASVSATATSAAGTYIVTATALGVSTGFSLTNVAPVAANIHGSPATQSALVGLTFPSPLVVTVTDAAGVPVSGLEIDFTSPASGASAVFSTGIPSFAQVFTDVNGQASVTATANYIPGSYTVKAATGCCTGVNLSVAFSLTNLQASTTPVTLVTSPNPSTFGTPVTLTATVSSPGARARMTFYDGVTPLGTKPVSSGATSFSTVLLSAGVHKLTAYYRDEANLIVGTSNAVTQTVKAVAGGAFITGNPVGVAVPALPPLASPLAVADFNHDGKVDFALTRFVPGFGDAVTVVLGNGDGTFQVPVNYAIGAAGATFIVAADFDGDGNTDLAAAKCTGPASCAASNVFGATTVSILLGNGDGTFRPAANLAAGVFGVSAMAVGDFNGDGKADLIFAIAGVNTPPIGGIRTQLDSPLDIPGATYFGSLEILPGNGDGTFGTREFFRTLPGTSTSPAGLNPLFVVADFNGDGKPDAVATSGLAGPAILLGNGDGTAQNAVAINVGGFSVVTLLSGDFNGDGKTDLAVGGPASGTNAATTILLGNGDGTFQPPVSYPFGIARTSGDFNGDGFADLVVADALGNTVGILYGKGDGTFQQGVSFSAGGPLAVTDFNSDSKADILTANTNGTISVLLGVTPPTNPPASITASGGTPQSVLVGVPFPIALQATVRDSNGLSVPGTTVTFTVPTVGPSAILSSFTATTNALGVASVTATANNIAGSYTVTATLGALSASFSLTNLLGGSSNLALGRTATQSSTLAGYPTDVAQSAVDGNTDGAFFDGSVTATNLEANPWWQVDLGASATLSSIVVWNRTDACCVNRLADYWVFVSGTPFLPTDTPTTLQHRAGTLSIHQTVAPNPSTTIRFEAILSQGRYVRVQLTGTDYLSLAEVQVFGTGAPPPADLAQGKSASQSSTFPGFASAVASSAVDGNTFGNFFNGSVTATNADPNAWWQVDLGASAAVNSVVIWNRTDCCGTRLGDYWVFVSDTPFLPTDTPTTLQNRAGTFASHQTVAPNPSATIAAGAQGRYVRVQLSGTNYLSLAEVLVLGTGGVPAPTNVAQGQAASQSSTFPGFATDGAASAVDGSTDGNFADGSVTATNLDPNPWWQVDLGASTAVSSIVIWNRTDCCGTRLGDYWVFVSDTPFLATDTPTTLQGRAGTFAIHQTGAPNPSTTIPAGAQGRYVRVQLTSANYLSLAEVQVFGQ